MGTEATSVDVFLQVVTGDAPIEGETTDPDFAPKEGSSRGIEITEFNFSGTATPGTAKKRKKKKTDPTKPDAEDDDEPEERPEANSFSVTKNVDSSSPQLMVAYCRTKSSKDVIDGLFPSVKVIVRKSGGEKVKFLIFVFENVYVTGYEIKVGAEYPEETITFAFQSIEMRYSPQGQTGTRTAQSIVGWDFGAVKVTSGGGEEVTSSQSKISKKSRTF